MSSDLSVVTILDVTGKVAVLRVRSDDAPETNGCVASRSFALQAIAEAWERAADEGFKVPKKPRPIDLEVARWEAEDSDWRTESFMKSHVGDYIARTTITSRMNVCDGSRAASDELVTTRDKTEGISSAVKREDALAKAFHYIVLEVTVTDKKWLEGLKPGLVFGSTAYDIWGKDPLFPKLPKGTPWVTPKRAKARKEIHVPNTPKPKNDPELKAMRALGPKGFFSRKEFGSIKWVWDFPHLFEEDQEQDRFNTYYGLHSDGGVVSAEHTDEEDTSIAKIHFMDSGHSYDVSGASLVDHLGFATPAGRKGGKALEPLLAFCRKNNLPGPRSKAAMKKLQDAWNAEPDEWRAVVEATRTQVPDAAKSAKKR